MAHKKKHEGPVPPDNRPQRLPGAKGAEEDARRGAPEVASAQEQDPKRRIGDYEGQAEHSLQEPGGKNDANH
jgi:hypothetical protein